VPDALRLRPAHKKGQSFDFGLTEKTSHYDLPQFLRQDLVNGQDIKGELELAEPPFSGYKRTEAGLWRYLELSHSMTVSSYPYRPRFSTREVTMLEYHASRDCFACSVTCLPMRRSQPVTFIRDHL
jgi:hypothetical protein